MRMKIGHMIVKMEGLLDQVTEMMSHDTELHLRGPHGIIVGTITLVESDLTRHIVQCQITFGTFR